jgi:hypothetical protein
MTLQEASPLLLPVWQQHSPSGYAPVVGRVLATLRERHATYQTMIRPVRETPVIAGFVSFMLGTLWATLCSLVAYLVVNHMLELRVTPWLFVTMAAVAEVVVLALTFGVAEAAHYDALLAHLRTDHVKSHNGDDGDPKTAHLVQVLDAPERAAPVDVLLKRAEWRTAPSEARIATVYAALALQPVFLAQSEAEQERTLALAMLDVVVYGPEK